MTGVLIENFDRSLQLMTAMGADERGFIDTSGGAFSTATYEARLPVELLNHIISFQRNLPALLTLRLVNRPFNELVVSLISSSREQTPWCNWPSVPYTLLSVPHNDNVSGEFFMQLHDAAANMRQLVGSSIPTVFRYDSIVLDLSQHAVPSADTPPDREFDEDMLFDTLETAIDVHAINTLVIRLTVNEDTIEKISYLSDACNETLTDILGDPDELSNFLRDLHVIDISFPLDRNLDDPEKARVDYNSASTKLWDIVFSWQDVVRHLRVHYDDVPGQVDSIWSSMDTLPLLDSLRVDGIRTHSAREYDQILWAPITRLTFGGKYQGEQTFSCMNLPFISYLFATPNAVLQRLELFDLTLCDAYSELSEHPPTPPSTHDFPELNRLTMVNLKVSENPGFRRLALMHLLRTLSNVPIKHLEIGATELGSHMWHTPGAADQSRREDGKRSGVEDSSFFWGIVSARKGARGELAFDEEDSEAIRGWTFLKTIALSSDLCHHLKGDLRLWEALRAEGLEIEILSVDNEWMDDSWKIPPPRMDIPEELKRVLGLEK